VNAEEKGLRALPVDASFPPSSYERMSLLLRSGVLGFFVLATVGMIAGLLTNPSETVSDLLASNPSAQYGTVGAFLGRLFGFAPDAIVVLGIFILIAVTIGRVVLAVADFYRGRERVLGMVSLVVVLLLLVGLFVVGPFVR
jgi:uncharacterized membrane protein